MKLFVVGLIFFISSNAFSQDVDLLDFYGDAMLHTYDVKHRKYAHEQFYTIFKQKVYENNAFLNLDEEITGINVLMPADSSFRLYSWQLDLGDKLEYVAFLITKNGKVFEFENNNDDLGLDFKYYVHTPDDWYGAVYYKLFDISKGKHTQYLVSGFKRIDKFTKSKVIDVLCFDENGVPFLGKELFHKPVPDSRDDIYTKLFVSYDKDAYVDFNVTEDNERIVYDHLVSKMSKIPGRGMTKYPDGTYEAFEKKGKKYVFIENLYEGLEELQPTIQKKEAKK